MLYAFILLESKCLRCKADSRCQARVPERFHPGRYDVWGSSHQIFHVLILLAAMSQLIGLLTAFHHARTSAKC